MLTPDEIQANKARLISLLRSTGREGIEKVIDFLESNGFFEMPSSLHRHHNWEGGLVQHCLGVYDRMLHTGETLEPRSVVVTSCLHDVCKTGKIYRDSNGNWREKSDEELDIKGHGSRSVKLLENLGFPLTEEENRAIRWHMGGWKVTERPREEVRDFFATKRSDLWRVLHNADRYDASHHSGTTER